MHMSLAEIDELTLRQLRAFTTAIKLQKKAEEIRHQSELSWLARSISSIVALTVPVEKKGDTNKLFEAARVMAINPDESNALKAVYDQPYDIDGENGEVSNRNGSFERLMGGFKEAGGGV